MLGQGRDELLVAIRIRAPQTMVEVENRQTNSLLRAYFLQNAKQSDGVRAARNAHAHTIAGPPHCVTRDRRANALNEIKRQKEFPLNITPHESSPQGTTAARALADPILFFCQILFFEGAES